MELKDTVDMMLSNDYMERLKAEYYQAEIRYYALGKMLSDWDDGELDFTLTCPKMVLAAQHGVMRDYLDILKRREFEEGLVK